MGLKEEILRRRTFAIISHPDAGKTTLTEKLLLFGGAIHVAGAVKSNKIRKTATSGLHGNRTPEGHLGGYFGHGIRVRRHQGEHPRYAGARRLRGGYLPNPDGRRQCHHRHRRCEGRGDADAQTDERMPHAQDAGDGLREQARQAVPRPVRPAGRDRDGTQNRRPSALLSREQRPRFQGGLQHIRWQLLGIHLQ